LKPKKCKICKEVFTPQRPLQSVCGYKCASEKARIDREKKEAKEWSKRKSELKEEIKTLTDWKKDLEKEINKLVKIIDKGMNCISCGNSGKEQAGHYHSVGSNGSLRFHLDNIHLQDYYCNVKLSANIIGYDEGLIRIYGKEYWEKVKFDLVRTYPLCKFDEEKIREAIKETRAIIRELQKIDLIYPPKARLRLRAELNKRIGLYNETT